MTAPTAVVTTATLTVSPNPLADGQPATLTATVTPAPTGSPAGTISFYSGTTLLGTGTLNASGVATFATSSLVPGADSVTAVYPGNAGFAASTSSAVSETVTTAYTVTAPATPVPIAPGGAAIIDITVPPLGGAFDGVVTLSATGLPPGATATFNPPTVTPGSAGAPTVLTIQLATLTASNLSRDISANHGGLLVPLFGLGFVLFGTGLACRRIPGRIQKRWGWLWRSGFGSRHLAHWLRRRFREYSLDPGWKLHDYGHGDKRTVPCLDYGDTDGAMRILHPRMLGAGSANRVRKQDLLRQD